MSESRTNANASLSARVARFVQSQPTSRRSGRARATVIAQRDEIARAIADGWAVKAIWQTLKADGAVTVGYHAFRRHVAELVAQPAQQGATAKGETSDSAESAPGRRVEARGSGFQHTAVPQKEEIY